MYQLIVIGGGASGLAAAVTAAECGVRRIAVLEKLPRTGKKLLATGNGRCNLSHAGISGKAYYGTFRPQEILNAFGNAETFFAGLGLYCRTDAEGRMYPYSMQAAAVLDAFRLRMQQCGIAEICGQEVLSLWLGKGFWEVQTAEQTYTAEKVIFAAGGHAAPQLGTDGSAWALLEKLHIPMIQPRPILCPVLADGLHPLKGLRVKGRFSLLDGNAVSAVECGELQFTEKALSGICMFNLSGKIDTRRVRDLSVSADFLPEETVPETLVKLRHICRVRKGSKAEDLLTGMLPKLLGRAVLKRCGIPSDRETLTGPELQRIAQAVHAMRFPVKGLGDFKQAQATAGGVHGKALCADLEVKGKPGLYVTGEAVDVQSICGGYHLHWCWASGWTAGKAAARALQQKGARS